jgi:sec-independent protein translocase protein TatB
MFDISWGELLLIGVVALIVIGPKELPSVLRTVGQWMTKLRRMANEFQGQFQEAIREAEMADLKKEVDDLATQAKSYTNFDPLGDVQKDIEKTFADKPVESAAAATAEVTTASAAVASPALSADTPHDVTAPVESAMRAAAELNAPPAEMDWTPAASQSHAVPEPAPVAPQPAPSTPLPAAAAEPASSVSAEPAPVAPKDDWPEPASFREPLGSKRNAGGSA